MRRNSSIVDVMCDAGGAVNDANEVSVNPVTVFPGVPGRLRALRGRELELAQQVRANVSWKFECRQSGISPTMWLCESGTGRLLNVEVSIPDERNVNFEVLCSERVQ